MKKLFVTLILSLFLLGCSGTAPESAAWKGNMSWDKQTYTIDESKAASILAFVEFLSMGAGVGIPMGSLNKEQKEYATKTCLPFEAAGMTLNRTTGNIRATCMYDVPESRFRNSSTEKNLLERGWKYQGKFGTKHIFVKVKGMASSTPYFSLA